MPADEMTTITVSVPRSRVPDLLERAAELMRDELERQANELIAADAPNGTAPPGNHSPTAGHIELASLSNAPVRTLSVDQLKEHLRLGHGQTLPSVGRGDAGQAQLHQFLHEETRPQTHGHGGGDNYKAVQRPWQPGDEAIAAEVVQASRSPYVRAAWRAFALSGPENRLSGPQLDAAMGIGGRRRNGVLARMSASCRIRGRVGAWEWDASTNTYWMKPLQAELFSRALGDASA